MLQENTAAMITDEQLQRLEELTQIFLDENSKLNLSALRTHETCWYGNILDSVAALDILDGEPKNVLDIGTGGGFPLLPLAVCLPTWKFTGMDSTTKKIDAIRRIADAMNLQNITLVAGRTEELGQDADYREQFDIVTARAVAPLNTLLEYAAPFAKVRGHLLFWKSMNIDQELKDSLLARAELGCHSMKQFEYDLEGDWGKRQILIFEKASKTHKKYPREIGTPKKTPLL